MSANFFLPYKATTEVTYTVTTPGTYTWTAPQATTPWAPYKLTVQMWSAGGSGSRGTSYLGYIAGTGAGGGAYVYSEITVVPGQVYTIVVGAGGAALSNASYPTVGSAGNAGGATYFQESGYKLIEATGGTSNYTGVGVGGTIASTTGRNITGSGATTSNQTTFTTHGLVTGAAITLASGTLGGLTVGPTYYVIRVDANTLAFATNVANAVANTRITLSGTNSGVINYTAAANNLYINGANGGVGYNQGSPAANGGSVSPAYSQPGGTGGLYDTNGWTDRDGGGGGASPFASGGNGGQNRYGNYSLSGGGGGAGYVAGSNGYDITPGDIGANTATTAFYGAGGAGGNGRVTFLFVTAGSVGVAPA